MHLMTSVQGHNGGTSSYLELILSSPDLCEARCLKDAKCYACSYTMLPTGPKCRLYEAGMYTRTEDSDSVLYIKQRHDSKNQFISIDKITFSLVRRH